MSRLIWSGAHRSQLAVSTVHPSVREADVHVGRVLRPQLLYHSAGAGLWVLENQPSLVLRRGHVPGVSAEQPDHSDLLIKTRDAAISRR